MKIEIPKIDRRQQKLLAIIFGVIILLIFTSVIVRKTYIENIKPVSGDTTTQVVTIKSGSTTSDIASALLS